MVVKIVRDDQGFFKMSGSRQKVVKQTSGSCQAVVKKSSGSHQKLISQTSGSHQIINKINLPQSGPALQGCTVNVP